MYTFYACTHVLGERACADTAGATSSAVWSDVNLARANFILYAFLRRTAVAISDPGFSNFQSLDTLANQVQVCRTPAAASLRLVSMVTLEFIIYRMMHIALRVHVDRVR